MITLTLLLATYKATAAEWQEVAAYFSEIGETRIASTITEGIARQEKRLNPGNKYPLPDDWQYGLRFKGGSVEKLNRAVSDFEAVAIWGDSDIAPKLPG